MEYIEQNCTITHEGRTFESGGAMVTKDFIIAYPLKDGVLGDWHGNPIGTWRTVASWRIRSFMSSHMFQIEATVDGVLYTGRGCGEGMSYKGKVKRTK